MTLRLHRWNGEQVTEQTGDCPDPLRAAADLYHAHMGDVSKRLKVSAAWVGPQTISVQTNVPNGYTVTITH